MGGYYHPEWANKKQIEIASTPCPPLPHSDSRSNARWPFASRRRFRLCLEPTKRHPSACLNWMVVAHFA